MGADTRCVLNKCWLNRTCSFCIDFCVFIVPGLMSLPYPLFSTAQQKVQIQLPTGTSFRWKNIFCSHPCPQSLTKKQKSKAIYVWIGNCLFALTSLGWSPAVQQRELDSRRDRKTWDLDMLKPKGLRSQEEMQFQGHKAAWKSGQRASPWQCLQGRRCAPALVPWTPINQCLWSAAMGLCGRNKKVVTTQSLSARTTGTDRQTDNYMVCDNATKGTGARC